MKKRLLSVLLAMSMMLSLLPVEARTQDLSDAAGGTCGLGIISVTRCPPGRTNKRNTT